MYSVLNSLQNCSWAVADGCSSGWVLAAVQDHSLFVSYVSSLNFLRDLNLRCFVDIPVKLPVDIHHYPRESDKIGKKLLGKYHSSIFYAPLSSWLYMNYLDINDICILNAKPKISKQSFNLFNKIKDVQSIDSAANCEFIEIHPELIIHHFLKNSKASKTTIFGQQQRLDIMSNQFNVCLSLNDIQEIRQTMLSKFDQAKLKNDDLIDAIFVATFLNSTGLFRFEKKSDNIISDDLLRRFKLFI